MKIICLLIAAMIPSIAAELRIQPSPALQNAVTTAVSNVLSTFSEQKLKPADIALTVYDLTDPSAVLSASYRGDVPIYPASVVKLFYLVAAQRWMEDGKLADTPELRRAMRDMIVDSSNDATHYVIDVITGTTGGPELPSAQMAEWEQKRSVINDYFISQGYTDINVKQKPWGDGPFGRERAFFGQTFTNRNALTTDATARLLCEIVLQRAVSPSRSREMLDLLKREPTGESTGEDDQAHAFSAKALPAGTRLWSKAGWTTETRHDAAYVELPDGRKMVIVVFTLNHSSERQILPAIVREVLAASRRAVH
jgi:hypothetical protein